MIIQVPYTSRDSDPKEILLIHRTDIPNTVIYGVLCEQGGMPLISQHRNLRYVVWAGRDAADDARVDAVSDEHAIDDEPAPDDLRSAPATSSGTVTPLPT
jgi:hypothetical protein